MSGTIESHVTGVFGVYEVIHAGVGVPLGDGELLAETANVLALWAPQPASLTFTGGTYTGLLVAPSATVEFSPALAAALGLPIGPLTTGTYPAQSPTGYLVAEMGISDEIWEESADLNSWRWGCGLSVPYAGALVRDIDAYLTNTQWAAYERTPIAQARGRVTVTVAGISAVLDPYTAEVVERSSIDDYVHVRWRGLVTTVGSGATSGEFADTARAIICGWSPIYHLCIDGLPYIFSERSSGEVTADMGLGGESVPCLVIDESARVGAQVDPVTLEPKAFSLFVRLNDAPETLDLFSEPRAVGVLESWHAVGPSTYTGIVQTDTDSVTRWDAVYIGRDGYKNVTAQAGPTGVILSVGKLATNPQDTPIPGDIVSTRPLTWAGRKTLLGLTVLPAHATGPGSDVGVKWFWQGQTTAPPSRIVGGWSMTVQDVVRRLQSPLGVRATGQGRVSFGSDAAWDDDYLGAYFSIRFGPPQAGNTISLGSVEAADHSIYFSPWGATDWTVAKAMDYVASQLNALLDKTNHGGNETITASWVEAYGRNVNGSNPVGTLRLCLSLDNPTLGREIPPLAYLFFGPRGAPPGFQIAAFGQRQSTPTRLVTDLAVEASAVSARALLVDLEDRRAVEIPQRGAVMITVGGDSKAFTYRDASAAETYTVRVSLNNPLPSEWITPQRGQIPEISVEWLFWVSGTPGLDQAMVAACQDSPREAGGLGISAVAPQLSAALTQADITDIFATPGSSWWSVFGWVSTLGRYAAAQRRRAGVVPALEFADVSPAVGFLSDFVITDECLAFVPGRSPVRVIGEGLPSSYDVTGYLVPDEPMAKITVQAPEQSYWSVERHKVSVYGVKNAKDVITDLGFSLFESSRSQFVIEVDVDISVAAQVGDVVSVNLTSPALWDGTKLTRGYNGLARVMGSQLQLTTGVWTLALAVNSSGQGPLSPAAEIIGEEWNPGFTGLVAVTVSDGGYFARLWAADDPNNWRVVVYKQYVGVDGWVSSQLVANVTVVGGDSRIEFPAPVSTSLIGFGEFITLMAYPSAPGQKMHVHGGDARKWV